MRISGIVTFLFVKLTTFIVDQSLSNNTSTHLQKIKECCFLFGSHPRLLRQFGLCRYARSPSYGAGVRRNCSGRTQHNWSY